MRTIRTIAVSVVALTFLLTAATTSLAGAPPQTTPASPDAESHNVLPLLQDKIPEVYREHVPLPFGVSFNYLRLDERLAFTDPSLVFNGQVIPPQLLQVGSAATVTDSYTARFDAWILPFLNVYGTATRISGEASDIKAQIFGFPPVIPERVEYSGTGYGVGLTAAFGYRAFFVSYDLSYHWQTAGVLSQTAVASVQGPRVGLQLTPWGRQGNVYVGAMRQTLRGHQSGTLDLAGVGSLSFELRAEPEHVWNPTFGAEIGLTPHIRVNVEGGFGGRTVVLLGGGYRF